MLWLADGFAIVLASQLIGLLDIVNSPDFVSQGGWFQPLPTVPTTLGVLVQRVASLGVSWIVAGTLVDQFLGRKDNNSNKIVPDASGIKNSDWQVLIVFCSLRFLQGIFQSSMNNDMSFLLGESNDYVLTGLRDCYFVGLFTLALRYLYRQYFL
jgi:hypothetical protein